MNSQTVEAPRTKRRPKLGTVSQCRIELAKVYFLTRKRAQQPDGTFFANDAKVLKDILKQLEKTIVDSVVEKRIEEIAAEKREQDAKGKPELKAVGR